MLLKRGCFDRGNKQKVEKNELESGFCKFILLLKWYSELIYKCLINSHLKWQFENKNNWGEKLIWVLFI